MYIYIRIPDSVETVYELPLLPNSTASVFTKMRSGVKCWRGSDHRDAGLGLKVWIRDIGQNFSKPTFQTGSSNSPSYLHIFFLITFLEKAFVRNTLIILCINPLNPELNPICYLLAVLRAHHFLHVSRIRVKLLNFRLLMSYRYGAPILDVSRSHTTTQQSR